MQTFNVINHITEMAAQDEIERMTRIAAASKAYYGKYTPPLKTAFGKADDNALPNFARVIVDKGAAFLFGKEVDLDIRRPDGETQTDQDDDRWLDSCLKFNRFQSLMLNAATNGGISGHTFLKLNGARNGEKYPRIIILDSNSVFVTTDPEDITQVIRYRIQFNAIDPKDGKPIVRRQMIERDKNGAWTICDYVSKSGGGFTPMNSPIVWPFAWPPILDCQNLPAPNAYYGMSDLEPDILHLIERAHYVISNTGRINRFHAHPKTVGKGFKAGEVAAAPDDMIVLPSDTSDIKILEAHGDITGSLELYDKLYDALFMIARIPPVSVGKLETIGAVAGIALQILYAPIMEMTNAKRMLYAPMLEALGERLLEMGGYRGRSVDATWADPMPRNEVEQRQIASEDLGMGIVDKETIATKLGYDWSKIQARMSATSTDAAAKLMTAMENRPPAPNDGTNL